MFFFVILIIQVAWVVAGMFWLHFSLPSEVSSKYSWWTLLRGQFSVFSQWKDEIESVDIPVFRRYRTRVLVVFTGLAVTILLELIASYLMAG
jgi:hypothetical protein